MNEYKCPVGHASYLLAQPKCKICIAMYREIYGSPVFGMGKSLLWKLVHGLAGLYDKWITQRG
jgi:hypothetical protein